MKKRMLASAICGLGLMASGAASATVIGGVDFGPFGFHIDTTTLAETFVGANGDIARGYGVVNTINGNSAYAGTDKLFFIFDNYVAKDYDTTDPTDNKVNFSGGVIKIYKRADFNLLLQPSEGVGGNLDLIDDGILWATMTGHAAQGTVNTLSANGFFTGATLSLTGGGLLDVDQTPGSGLLDVQTRLNGNDIADGVAPGFGFADVALTTSANNRVLNPNDNTTGCRTGGAVAGQWCLAGSADLRGTIIPEPGVLALLGIGLLGVVTSRRKSKAA